jgi:hypothetical protein
MPQNPVEQLYRVVPSHPKSSLPIILHFYSKCSNGFGILSRFFDAQSNMPCEEKVLARK